MAIINILPAEFDDAMFVLNNLRTEDEFEVFSLGSRENVLKTLLEESLESYIGYVDGIPACVYGLRRDTLMSYGVPWLATSRLVERAPKAMARLAYDYIQSRLRREGVLEGWVLERNSRSQRWLRWMGFSLSEPFQMEPVGLVRHFIKRL